MPAKTGAEADLFAASRRATPDEIVAYYKAIGAATDLPMFIQTIGDMSVDTVVEMFKTIPTVEGGEGRGGRSAEASDGAARKDGQQAGGVRGQGCCATLIEEMQLGFTGFWPTVGMADIFQRAWELWQAGKPRESYDMFGRIQAFSTITNADQYVMVARGIFKEDTKSRPYPGDGFGRRGCGRRRRPSCDGTSRRTRTRRPWWMRCIRIWGRISAGRVWSISALAIGAGGDANVSPGTPTGELFILLC